MTSMSSPSTTPRDTMPSAPPSTATAVAASRGGEEPVGEAVRLAAESTADNNKDDTRSVMMPLLLLLQMMLMMMMLLPTTTTTTQSPKTGGNPAAVAEIAPVVSSQPHNTNGHNTATATPPTGYLPALPLTLTLKRKPWRGRSPQAFAPHFSSTGAKHPINTS